MTYLIMKKFIYVTTAYVALFVSPEIIYGYQLEKNKPNHGKQLSNFNPYHNFKKSRSSNEDQDNNKHVAFNDESHGELGSINIKSFENKDNAKNTNFALYNEPQNKNGLGSLKNFNHDNEKENQKAAITKISFIQNFSAPKFDSNIFNEIDMIYGIDAIKDSISFVTVKLQTLEELRDILYKFYSDKNDELKGVINNHNQIKHELNEIFKTCQPQKNEVINEMINLHNPLYNFYINHPMDNYKSYASSHEKFLNCLIPLLKKVEPKIDQSILSMSNTYKYLSVNKTKELKDILEKYAKHIKDHNLKILDRSKYHPILSDKKIIPFIKFLIDTLNSEKKFQSVKNKLTFLLKQFEDIKQKYIIYRQICGVTLNYINIYIQSIMPKISNKYFDEFKALASKISIITYNNDHINSSEKLYKYLNEVLFHIFKVVGKLLIDSPDPQNNLIFKDDTYEFDTSTPKFKFISLKNQFVEIFKDEWESYNNKNIEGSDSIDNNMILILKHMNKFKNLVDSIESFQINIFEEKANVLDEIQKKLDKTTYDERKEGLKSSLELAKKWEATKKEIITKLNKENDETVQLEEQIKDLFKKYSDIIAKKKYMKDLKLELSEKIKGISDKKEYIQKAIELEKEIKNSIVYIEELAKQSPYKINKYIEKKDAIWNTIKSELGQIYIGDFNKLYNELSSIVKDNAIDNTEDITKLEALKLKINNEDSKIQSMQIKIDASHLNIVEYNKNTLLNTILEIKKYIYEEISNEINSMLEDFKNKETNILSNINDYSKHNDELSNYKNTISEIRNKYNEKINIDNMQEEEARKVYKKYKEYMTAISSNENEILKNINELKYMKDKFLDKVNIYTNFDNDYKENVDAEHNKFITLTNKINIEVSNKELSKYEQKIDDNKALIAQTTKCIEEEYQNINTIKKANEYIKVCENTTELIKIFRNKSNELNEILNKNIETIKDTNSMEKSYTENFLNTLTNKSKELDKIFIDASLDDHEQASNGLKQYFNSLKESLGKNPESKLSQQFNEREKAFNDMIQKNEHINKNVSNIEMTIYASIHNISEDIENEIGKNIELLNAKVLEKVKANTTNLNEIKEKLKLYNFGDFGKEENIKYTNEINKIKDDIETLDKKIDKNIKALTEIKKKSENYIEEIKTPIDKSGRVTDSTISNDDAEEIEKKQKIIVAKIDKKKSIYEEINKLLNEISEIEKDKTSLEKEKDINLSYGKSLGNLFLDQIDEEKKKAEHTIKAIEEYMKDFDNNNKSQETEKEMKMLNISHDDGKNYYTISKNHEKNISDIRDKSLKIIKDLSKESNINNIKSELQKNVSDSQKHNSDINQYLSKISNVHNILKLNDIQNITEKIKKYTNEIENDNKKINDELSNSEALITKLKDNLSIKECQSKIESTVDDKYVNECIKNITDLKTYILSEETNINTYFKNAEEYNKNVILNLKNIEMADNKSQYILKTKKNNGTNNHDYNIDELKSHKDKSNAYKGEADKNTKAIEKNKELFEQYKQETTALLNKYFEVALKNKFDQAKKDSEQTVKEIKDAHNNFILQVGKSEQKINGIKKEQIRIEGEVANNDKSNKAIIDIQMSLEQLETRLLKINDIKKNSSICLKEIENIENQISNLSINSQETKLKDNEDKLNALQKLLESLISQKKNIEDQTKELDEANSKIENIENDISQNKKNYEMGIIEKIKENVDTNKKQIESIKKLIKPTIQNLISSFNARDLEGVDTNESLEKYNTKMNNIYEEFIKSYNLITNYSETISKEPIAYDQIKNARIAVQNELLKNIENGNKAKSYLDEVKVNEFDKMVTYLKNKLNTVNDKFNNEYLKVNEELDNISKSINNVKNSTDENSLLDILNQTKQGYADIASKTHYNYKYEAENIFRNISKLANSLNIQIQNSSGINLFENINIAILSSLDSETKDTLKFIPHPQNESEIYTIIRNSYDTLLDIFKKSQDMHKKEQYTLNLMNENRHLYEKVRATNEFKGALSDTKRKKEKILNDVKLVLHKFNELSQLICDSQNYDTILELSKQNQIKEKIDNYEKEKLKFGMDFNVATVEEKLDNIIKSLEKFENNHDSSEKKDSNMQYNDQLNEITKVFNTEIKNIENKIIGKNDLIDKLAKMRKECLLFTYTTLAETLKSKVTNYSKFITSATKFSKEYLEYINNSIDSLNDDIDTLQTKYNLNQTSKYATSKLADAINNNNDLIEKEKEATQAINNLTKLFTIDSNNIDVNTLHNNKLQMIYFDSELHKLIEPIKQLYKKMHAFKLSNIGQINQKYFDISKQFDNILQLQKNKLTENLNNLKEVEQYISDKKNSFLHTINENTNSNSNAVKEIYNNIITRENKAHDIENINNKENENIALYTDTITKLTEKIQNILNFVTTHENDNNIIKQHIQDNDENDVSKIEDSLKNTIQSFQKIQNKIDENKAQFYGNNNINNIVTTISQNINDVKTQLHKDLIMENKLVQLQKGIENIKNSTYEIRSEQVAKYVNTIHNYVEQAREIQNNPNKDKIDDIIQKIINYNKESEIKLHTIIDNKNRVMSMVSRIKNPTNLTKSEYNAAIKYEEDANSIILDLNTSQNMLNHLINHNLYIINDLRKIKQHIQNRSNLYTINRQQEITQTKHFSNTQYRDINDTKNINKSRQYSSSNGKGSSKGRNTGNTIKFAGAIAFGLVVCYAVTKFQKKKGKDEMSLNGDERFYDDAEKSFFEREDDVIEISMNDDL
ncbi:reticulocyte binding protein, putative [Plasmodium vinckei lentum]|uniref:Reticulocyte binding protein, putative n=1 Tax=Plasmodium vinckei lentum TaxID=138297 RepID=A0A6V7SGH7_PLAVN|nr:reticulocyte binding protein, putative [Plasmodium vinckei lentum]